MVNRELLLERIDAALQRIREVHTQDGECLEKSCPICDDIRKAAIN